MVPIIKLKKSKQHAREKGVVCASAGNHAQGVAYACAQLKIQAKIFMPQTTPKQKIDQVRMFGREYVEIILAGDTFDDSAVSATCLLRRTWKSSSIHLMISMSLLDKELSLLKL